MADESMEICPARYGEDFDFDFDLTAPFEDDETVLGDVTSTAHNVSSQANYSLMINDYDSESTKEMNEIEAPTDCEKSESDHDTKSLIAGNEPNLDVTHTNSEHISDQIHQEYVWHSQSEGSTNEMDGDDADSGEIWDDEQRFVASAKDDFKQEPQVFLHGDEDLQKNLFVQECESVVKAPLTKLATAGGVNESSDMTESYKQTHSFVPSSPNHSPNFLFKSENAGQISDLSYVIVVYQSNEYPLFLTSEFDDADTFFIKDRTIAQKPLSDFFWAIRDVIYEDLDNESELWLSIPELGLQIEETSSLLQNVTFLELVSLRRKLLLNDGVQQPQPMYIDLGIRKNFVRELMRITNIANDGKGLSGLDIWNELSEDDEVSIVIEGGPPSPSEKISNCSKSIVDEEPEENYFNYETEITNKIDLRAKEEEAQSSEKAFTPEPERGQQGQNKSDFLASGDTSTSRICYESGSSELFRDENPKSPEVKEKDNGLVSNCPYDTESDIIDYSEDELDDSKKSTGTTVIINDRKFDSCWKNDQSTVKNSVICDEEITNILIPNASRKNTENDTSTQDGNSKYFEQDRKCILNQNTCNEIDFRALDTDIDERKNGNQENNSGSPYDPITDLTTHIDIPSADHQVKINQPNDIDLDAIGEKINQDDAQINKGPVCYDRITHQSKENTDFLKIGDSPTGDRQNISPNSKNGITEAYTMICSKEVSKASIVPKTSTDRRFDESLVGPSSEQDIPTADLFRNENEDEIDYEEDEEDSINMKHISSKLLIKPVIKPPLSTKRKRPIIDCKLEATMDKRSQSVMKRS